MKRYANVLILFGFICLWLNVDSSQADRQAVKAGLNNLFNEPDPTNYVRLDSVVKFRVIANPSKIGWFIAINKKQLENLGVDLSKVTKAKLDAWKVANMENQSHLQWGVGDSWEQVATDAGLEPVPPELP